MGAIGTASFGIVEGLKWTVIGTFGYPKIREILGKDCMAALVVAYGKQYDDLLQAQYRQDEKEQRYLSRTLRQGIRAGLTPDNAEAIALSLGVVDPKALRLAVEYVKDSTTSIDTASALPDDHRSILGRFELALDMRIDAALVLAEDKYIGAIRCTAALVSIIMALIACWILNVTGLHISYGLAFLIGVVAVPIAPISNDLVGALQAANKALQAKQ